MSGFTLSAITPADHRRMAEVQHAAFWPEDPLSVAALLDVDEEEHINWIAAGLDNPKSQPGHKFEYVCAKDVNGKIAAWAKWAIPLGVEEQDSASGKEPEGQHSTLPKGVNEEIWNAFFIELDEHEKRIMKDCAHWCTSIVMISLIQIFYLMRICQRL
jgi:hypothetical protein